ncbi:tyrosine-type recombinase/integrase [Nannocystis radixulma]|uniref:Tyrosine-type recombinase/integrase n=1 Tax=Nannocystis radixulma TaxID=2995305 RepID=A0ABT5B2U7_9BACT|nr:tyrosine-type recombinase/integrase [Nannocystis radixulma]MDC0668432.1 tyrosine-type recombinase/integrase [Nannocystis radixulma]
MFGPHRVRHSVLTFLAERGVKPYALQAFARHEDLKTTNRYYVHVNKRALAREAVDALAMSLGNGVATLDNGPQFPVAP